MRQSTVLLLATIGFGLLYLAATLALGAPPGDGESGRAVVAWFANHGGPVRASVWFLTLSTAAFATFAALVRARLPAPHRDVFFFGAIAFAAETAVQSWFWAGMTWHADQLSPAAARALLDVASFWGPVLNGTTVTMLAPIVVLGLQRDRRLPRWIGLVAAVACGEQLVETITIFGQHGFIAPGGAMNTELGAGLVALALLSLGVNLSRRGASTRDRPF